MRFFNLPAGGHDNYAAPEALRRLPWTLWRSHLYPRRPELVGQAAQNYLEERPLPVAYLPQSMGFTRWKTPPYDVAYGSNVTSLLAALRQRLDQVQGLQAAAMGGAAQAYAPEQTIADPINRLPEPNDNLDPNLNTPAYARNALPLDRIMTADQLNAFVRANRETRANDAAQKMVSRSNALEVAAETRARIQSVVGDRSQAPWFMQEPQ